MAWPTLDKRGICAAHKAEESSNVSGCLSQSENTLVLHLCCEGQACCTSQEEPLAAQKDEK